MYNELLSQLKTYGATDAQIDEWLEQWRTASTRTGKPLPCPKCLYDGRPTGRLHPLPAPPKRAKSKCAVCKIYFEYPDLD